MFTKVTLPLPRSGSAVWGYAATLSPGQIPRWRLPVGAW